VSGGIAPHVNFGTRWRSVVSFTGSGEDKIHYLLLSGIELL